MPKKDFYKILEISPTASKDDIKKSYRQLVVKYHPDKHAGNRLYEAKFNEIHEAYKVLGDVKKREDYDFQMFHKTQQYTATTPQSIVKQAGELRRKTFTEDPERINRTALLRQIEYLISDYNRKVLTEGNDHLIIKKIVQDILACMEFLPLAQVNEIALKLSALSGTDNELQREIFNFSKNAQLRHYWQYFKIPLVIILSFLLCFFIYRIGRGI